MNGAGNAYEVIKYQTYLDVSFVEISVYSLLFSIFLVGKILESNL